MLRTVWQIEDDRSPRCLPTVLHPRRGGDIVGGHTREILERFARTGVEGSVELPLEEEHFVLLTITGP